MLNQSGETIFPELLHFRLLADFFNTIVPYLSPRKKRIGGQNLLRITYIAEDFDGPLPPEIQKYFDGEDDE